MNEKIKEIMYNVDDINILNEVGTDADFLADIDPQRLEKFAELIIQECTNILHNPDAEPYSAEWTWRKHFIKQIKQHFGVDK